MLLLLCVYMQPDMLFVCTPRVYAMHVRNSGMEQYASEQPVMAFWNNLCTLISHALPCWHTGGQLG